MPLSFPPSGGTLEEGHAAPWRASDDPDRESVAPPVIGGDQAVPGRWSALALRREQLGVEIYAREAEIDESLGGMALAAAVAQRGERLAAMGLEPAAIEAGKQALLAMAETARIQRALANDPGRARALLATRGAVLSEQEQAALVREIDAEQRQSKPDWLRVMRLNALRLKLMSRLLAFAPSVTPGNAPLPA